MEKLQIKEITVKQLKKLSRAVLDENGHELLNPDPIEVPAGIERPLSLQERMARVLRQEFSQQAMEQGRESFEESNDFDTGENDFWEDMSTPYTLIEEEYLETDSIENADQHNTDTPDTGSIGNTSGEGSPDSGENTGNVPQVDNGIAEGTNQSPVGGQEGAT